MVVIVVRKVNSRRGKDEPVFGHESRADVRLRRRLALVDMDIAYHLQLHSQTRHSEIG
jgi:hypothetical protein